MVTRRRVAALLIALAGLSMPSTAGGDTTKEAIRAQELAFADTVEARDPKAFRSFLAEDAIFVGSGGILRGPEAVLEGWRPLLEPGGPLLSWQPDRIAVAEDGTSAVTSGPFRLVRPDGTVRTGRFVSAWRWKEGEGWRILVDVGIPPATSAPKPPLLELFDDEELFVLDEVAEGAVSFAPPPALETLDATSLVLFRRAGVLVIDPPGFPQRAQRLVRLIQDRTDTPVRWIVQTHWHTDHVTGTPLLLRHWPGAVVIGHRTLVEDLPTRTEEALADQIQRWQGSIDAAGGRLSELEDPESRRAMERRIARTQASLSVLKGVEPVVPSVLVDDRLELRTGDLRVILRHLPGHTRGDLTAEIPELGLLAAGDLVDAAPYAGDGNLERWREALTRILGSAATVVVPGHGRPETGMDRVAALRGLLDQTVEVVDATRSEGSDLESAKGRMEVPEEVRRTLTGDSDARQRLFDRVVDRLVEHRWRETDGAADPTGGSTNVSLRTLERSVPVKGAPPG